MVKRVLIMGFLCLLFGLVKADHLSGSELVYEYLGKGAAPDINVYRFTYRLFRECSSTSPTLDFETVTLGMYQTKGLQLYTQLTLAYQGTVNIALNTSTIRCFSGTLSACYGVGIFTGVIELPATPDGFTAAWIRCCRPANIINVPGSDVGITPVVTIPGTNTLPIGNNTCASFYIRDTSLVCAGKEFRIDFSASDKDGDSLSYHFASGNNWSPQLVFNPGPQPQLKYSNVSYASGFSASDPMGMGTGTVINSQTGEMKGIAPTTPGRYLIAVAVLEWRNGKKINEHIKEIPVTVGNCDFVEVVLPDKIINCSSKQVYFENLSSSSGITAYKWTFDTLKTGSVNSSLPTPMHSYPDTGTYTAKLVVTGKNGCKDSATTEIMIYPGLKAGFTVTGICIQYPYQFTDTSSSKAGRVIKWNWSFGELTSVGENSSLANPAPVFLLPGIKNIRLVAESDKGCKDTTYLGITIRDKPSITMGFRDTSICRTDSIKLIASSIASRVTYNWLPLQNIQGNTNFSPLVYPDQTQRYYLQVTENGCMNSDSVLVTVLAKDAVTASNDTIVCLNDSVTLIAITNASKKIWIGDISIADPQSSNTTARPSATTDYIIIANPGKCETRDTIHVKTIAYPVAVTAGDTTICFGGKVQLKAKIIGSFFKWVPLEDLFNKDSLNPISAPSRTTKYILTVGDTLGCPKTVSNTITITVIPLFHVDAGRDTVAVAGQPLQLSALSTYPDLNALRFNWTPSSWLDDPFSSHPIAIFPAGIDSVKYQVKAVVGTCFVNDEVKVKIYKGGSAFYIPSAFSPNGDGLNDLFTAHSAGILKIDFLRIYNRQGQLIFETSDLRNAWDGRFKGVLQPQGTYVYSIRGRGYSGNTVEQNGTLVLIR